MTFSTVLVHNRILHLFLPAISLYHLHISQPKQIVDREMDAEFFSSVAFFFYLTKAKKLDINDDTHKFERPL